MKHDRKLDPSSRQAGHGRPKRVMSVQQALEWAFRVEHAQLELPEPPDPERGQGFGFGLEYVLMQRAALGCKIDGGQYKMGRYTHEDAEVIAATVSALPDHLGGKRMAIRMAELARAGLTPDWMPGAVPRCVPVEMKRNRHGDHATTVVVGTERVLSRGKWRTVEVRACPVIYRPHQGQIDGARRAYKAWWQALEWTRDGLMSGLEMKYTKVVSNMPQKHPWSKIQPTP
ncbi:hypothetical protein RYZ18_13875 [Roseovarius sp. 10]|uniref:hypothetical protein n=1 Tax=Roseovarius sp. 10 TaxID=3080563 RepID=UPI0029536EFA|nr:hypothetical protein [Roseovarius sp. 10]MDV7202416.1 hypothetical protein [Roseovarius sp. 10]